MNFNDLKGVIHVGANTGQETEDSGINFYNVYNLNVIWVEPIKPIFDILHTNISNYPKQKAFNELVTDQDNKEYDFYITSNNGESSSIFDFGEVTKAWPNLSIVDNIKLKSKTLSTLLKENDIDIGDYDCLTLDTQGSELLVLKGGMDILGKIKYVNMEVADFDSYKGCCKLEEVEDFFKDINYKRIELLPWNVQNVEGDYYTAVYMRCD